jgi:hypothetical protein
LAVKAQSSIRMYMSVQKVWRRCSSSTIFARRKSDT